MLAVALAGGIALAAPGDLDPGFDTDGKRTIDFGGGNDSMQAVLVQPDGKIVLAGGANAFNDIMVMRLNPDGSFDTSFDGDGTKTVDIDGIDVGSGLARQADGKLVVAGSFSGANHGSAVLRLNPDGSLDPSFGSGGQKSFAPLNPCASSFSAVVVQPDGKIVAAGSTGCGNHDLFFWRLNADGSFDQSFGPFASGQVSIDFGGNDVVYALALRSDGTIVAVGSTSVETGIAVVRLNANGSLDTSFDGDGMRRLDLGGDDRARAVVAQSDGKIVVAGEGGVGNVDAQVFRLNIDGSLDSSFAAGIVAIDFGSTGDIAYGLGAQADGKPILAGTTGGAEMAVARLTTGGVLDTSFDGDGKKTISFGFFGEAHAVAVQADGRIVLAGSSGTDVALARVAGDPPPPPAATPPPAAPPPATPPPATTRRCAGVIATIVGTTGNDRLDGTPARDVIVALDGDDIINGRAGDDLVCAGRGNDAVKGAGGNDAVFGGAGNDRLTGGIGDDSLLGEAGDDTLRAGAGDDKLQGGPDNDRLIGETGSDTCGGGSGSDSAAACETRFSIP